jgi:hypothetical protein
VFIQVWNDLLGQIKQENKDNYPDLHDIDDVLEEIVLGGGEEAEEVWVDA